MPEYLEVPVTVAKQIAERFRKNRVVILSYDHEHELTHVTTYGVEAFDKENAASVGRSCAKMIGCDLGKAQNFEDFHRDYDPAFLREAQELLLKILHLEDCSPVMLRKLERWARDRVEGYREGKPCE